MSKITISPAEQEDTAEIGKIAWQTAMVHYKSVPDEFKRPTLKAQTGYIQQSISDKDILVLKAELGEKIAGYAVVYFNTYPEKYFQFSKRGFIGSIGVDENYRGQGVGKSLLKGAEEELKKRGISVIEIDVYTFNQSAEKLYNASGYKDIKHYKRKFIG